MSKNDYKIWQSSLFIVSLLISSWNPSLATDFNPSAPTSDASTIDANSSANLMRAISQRNDLSPQAKNISVISNTENGSTILRGAVKNDREKQTIGALAEQLGLPNIKNELTVNSPVKGSAKTKKALMINGIKQH